GDGDQRPDLSEENSNTVIYERTEDESARQDELSIKDKAFLNVLKEIKNYETNTRSRPREQHDDSWESFKKKFLSEYHPLDHEVAMNVKLSRCFQRREENPISYMYRVLDLCKQVNKRMPDEEKLRHLLYGLRNRYREQLAAWGENRNLESCKNALRRIGAASQQYAFEESYKTECEHDNEKNVQIKNGNSYEERRFESNNNRSLFCYNCNGPHFLRNCRRPKDEASEANRKMLSCARQGIIGEDEAQVKTIQTDYSSQTKASASSSTDGDWLDWNFFNILTADEQKSQEGDNVSPLITLPRMENEKIQLPRNTDKNVIGNEIFESVRNGTAPRVTVMVNGLKIRGLLDSGSLITVISSELSHRLARPLYWWNLGNLRVADGRAIVPIGITSVMIDFNGRSILMEVAVALKITPPCILGNDFCTKSKLVIDFYNKHIGFVDSKTVVFKQPTSLCSQSTQTEIYNIRAKWNINDGMFIIGKDEIQIQAIEEDECLDQAECVSDSEFEGFSLAQIKANDISHEGNIDELPCYEIEARPEVESYLDREKIDEMPIETVEKVVENDNHSKKPAKIAIEKIQRHNEKYVKRKRLQRSYKVGELVPLRRPLLKVGRSKKLMIRYVRPLRVTKRISDINYELINLKRPFSR
ncbi:hypothetical protein B4U79_16926, partial [Dinothrombium tinctorium]